MIIDKELMLSENQAITADADSANVLDLGAEGDAVGQELTLHVMVSQTFAGTSTGSDTLQIKLRTSSDNSTYVDACLSPAIPFANLVAGRTIFKVRVPQGLKRYVKLNYDATIGTSWSAGKVSAFMVKDL